LSGDREELDRVIRGLLDGEAALYRIIRGKIDQYINHFGVRARTAREELVSDTLVTLLENLRKGKFCGNNLKILNVYIFGIVRHKLYNEWRKRTRIQESTISADDVPSEEPGADESLVRLRLVAQILSALSEECRELLGWKFREGWSDQEIADHLGKTKNAVSTAISRCVQKARDFINDQELL
jgi:RNA polymerase sigma factor (sigma-70 family)